MLKFHPNPGTILICDYGNCSPPEMCKVRPVLVVSPRLKRRTGLCAIVALSTTPPDSIEAYHCEITLTPPLPPPFDSPTVWVKADMLSTVGFQRLDLPRTKRDQYGKRKYLNLRISSADMQRVQRAMLCGLGLPHLTPHI